MTVLNPVVCVYCDAKMEDGGELSSHVRVQHGLSQEGARLTVDRAFAARDAKTLRLRSVGRLISQAIQNRDAA